jgi:hypothetical protein
MFKAMILFCAMYAGDPGPANTLSLTDRLFKWPCVSDAERDKVATMLVTLVGQGRQGMDEHFFENCISELAWEPNLYRKRIREAASGCAYMSTLVFAESD